MNQQLTTADGKGEGHVNNRRAADKLKTGERDGLKKEDTRERGTLVAGPVCGRRFE
jgi:hypothetical protein